MDRKSLETSYYRALNSTDPTQVEARPDCHSELFHSDHGDAMNSENSGTPGAAGSPEIEGLAVIVDDNQVARTVMEEMIKFLGMSVTTFSDPVEALHAIEDGKTQPDLLISDYSMPNMQGFELAQRVKELHPNMPVAILTGHGEGVLEKGEFSGDLLLTKPIELMDLKSALGQLLALGQA